MSEFKVKIVTLQPMRVATFWGFGEQPETIAFEKMEKWAESRNIRDALRKRRVFGFNNPDPHPGTPNYGYEVWVEIGMDEELNEEIPAKDFSGGLYAVARCEIPEGKYEIIGETWRRLVTWREESGYRYGSSQWLEQSIASDKPGIEFALDLHLPIAPQR